MTPTLFVLLAVAVFALFGAALSAAIQAALSTTTRDQAAQAMSERPRSRIGAIIDRRQPAMAAASAMRTAFVITFAAVATAAIDLFTKNPWTVLGVLIVVSALAFPLTRMVLSPKVGYKHPLRLLRLTAPFLWPLTKISSMFVENMAEDEADEQQEDKLAVMMERVSDSHVLEDDERSMLHSVFEISRTLVREVMVPRTDMISANVDQPLPKVLSLFTRSGYSRLPVIGESVDDLRGIVYLKDVIKRTHRRSDTAGLTVADVMREPVFVPETLMVDDLLHDMQNDSVHIAMVVDEYGGIAGLVTIEDLLEELVGEMVDEHDRAQAEAEPLGDGSFRVPARMPIDELGELFEMKIEDDDVDSAGGLLAKALGRVPIAGAEARIAGLVLRADRFEGRRKLLSWLIAARDTEEETHD